jgi:DNA-binding CsgD family transcriptional regulator
MGYALSSLTSAIYDMALRSGSWDNILDILSAHFPCCVVLVTGDDLSRKTNLVVAQRGLQPACVASLIGTYAAISPWPSAMADLAPNQVVHDEQVVAREQARESAFYKQWLSKQGDFAAWTGAVVLREGTRQLSIHVLYSPTDQTQLRERAAAVLGEALPHLGRAIAISHRARYSGGQGYLDAVVEELPFTIFFVDAEMRIHYSNYRAVGMQRNQEGPFTTADGILRASDEETDLLLRQMVQKTATSKRNSTSILQITRPRRDERYFAIARLASRPQHQYQLHDAILDPGPLVMLVVHGTSEVSSLPTDLLWHAFALTGSEAELAAALLSGATLADLAKEREVSKQTLRNQLVAVMRKTGTRRQSELISLLTRLALTCF